MTPCDRCGATMSVNFEICDRRGKIYFVQCDSLSCDRSGPEKESPYEAMEAYNWDSSASKPEPLSEAA